MSDQRYLPEVLFENGFTDLISVVPPGATISPGSNLKPIMLGKVPGRRNANGTWGGYPWLKAEHTVDSVREWMTWGANVGLRSANFPGLDIDSRNQGLGDMIEKLAIESLGWAPVRYGQRPKRLMMYATAEPFGRLRIWGTRGTPGKDDYEKHLVEFLGDGQQYLVYGVHPTGVNYEWTQDMREVLPDALTIITKESAEAFRGLVEIIFRKFGLEVFTEGDGTPPSKARVDQQGLLAPSIDMVYEAMSFMKNDGDFDGRDQWLNMAYALKAACGVENDHDAKQMFMDWSMKWEGDAMHPGGNDPEVVESEFDRCTGGPRIGWPWLAEHARGYGYNNAGDDFEPLDLLEDGAGILLDDGAIPEPPEDNGPPRWSDQWLAGGVLRDHGDRMRYSAESGLWYWWTGTLWEPDKGARKVLQHITETLCDLSRQRLNLGDAKAQAEAKAIASQPATSRVETLLRHAPLCAIDLASFDSDPMILNTPDGMIDLIAGKRLPSDPAALCSKITAVAPDFGGPCPEWRRFLAETTGGNRELETYLQRYAGYCLTGVTHEEQFSIWHGPGGNGKGTMQRAISKILGTYAGAADISVFTETNTPPHPTSLAVLAGKRFVTSSEADKKQKLSASRLKQVSGEDDVTAHFMRQDDFTYTPRFKLLILTNPMPTLHDTGKAMKRRLHFVPFTREPKQVDQHLGEKLEQEWPAILAWLIEGCLAWHRNAPDKNGSRLAPPQKVTDYTEDYFETADIVGRWVTERIEDGPPGSWTRVLDLFHDYNAWASAAALPGFKVSHTFSQELKLHLDVMKHPDTRQSGVRGKTLRAAQPSTELEPLP